MNEKNLLTQQEILFELKILEEWTKLKFDKILYDSSICNYKINESTLNPTRPKADTSVLNLHKIFSKN